MLVAAIGIGAFAGGLEIGDWVWIAVSTPMALIGLGVWLWGLHNRLRATGELSFFRPKHLTVALLGSGLALAAGLAINRLIVESGGACGTVSTGPCSEDTTVWFIVFFASFWASVVVFVVRENARARLRKVVPSSERRSGTGATPSARTRQRLAELSGLKRSREITAGEYERERRRILGEL